MSLLKGRMDLRPVRSKNMLGDFNVKVSTQPASKPAD